MFPHIPISLILEDLRLTRSVELTIENVLDGRLVGPAMFREPEVVQTPAALPNLAQHGDGVPDSSESWEDTADNNCDA